MKYIIFIFLLFFSFSCSFRSDEIETEKLADSLQVLDYENIINIQNTKAEEKGLPGIDFKISYPSDLGIQTAIYPDSVSYLHIYQTDNDIFIAGIFIGSCKLCNLDMFKSNAESIITKVIETLKESIPTIVIKNNKKITSRKEEISTIFFTFSSDTSIYAVDSVKAFLGNYDASLSFISPQNSKNALLVFCFKKVDTLNNTNALENSWIKDVLLRLKFENTNSI